MTLPAPTYDLVLLLDLQAEPDARAKIVADARASVETQGELLRYDEWGERVLAYPIDKKTSAEYHLMQFHAGDAELLSGLDRSLRLDDGVLRHRIIKLKPGVPDAPDMRASAAPARPAEAEPQPDAQPAAAEPEVVAEVVVEAEPEIVAEVVVEAEPEVATEAEAAPAEPAGAGD